MNPYESPAGVNQGPPTATLYWQVLAIVLWLLGLSPLACLVAVLLTRGLPADFARNDPGVWFGVGAILLPLITFGLFGLASWRRSRRLAKAGIIASGVYVATLVAAFLFGIVR